MINATLTEMLDSGAITDSEFLEYAPKRMIENFNGLISPRSMAAIMDTFGGIAIYIPSNSGSQSKLEKILPPEEFEALSQHFGGDALEIARGRQRIVAFVRKKEISKMMDAGESQRNIALKVGVGTRWIRRMLNG